MYLRIPTRATLGCRCAAGAECDPPVVQQAGRIQVNGTWPAPVDAW